MANYQEAFQYAFSNTSEIRQSLYCNSDRLIYWQSLYNHGFSAKEVQRIFEHIYAFELWSELKGEQIQNQQAAGLLLLINAQGYLSVILSEMQNYFNINLSSQMCACTLNQINTLPENKLIEWLAAAVDYFSLIENRRLENMIHAIKT
ncbi:hypothetical protein N473_09685 [Pseudoalteromonas luteoviolacea CPMOR-1]|uniref:Uncharacterized protein n=1 Tax=Pseudoalteromonas luteoviolacea CPMOR-1 TaxID=1365248 RepID=A0A167MN59_9GAMM|nr:hypothetical protein [Pseudoalteromonas luteoviolacea]KZN66655.1 hypothetical protein N473_09685 [Pseudoalteromonas luteoviolacea CPMOR-1]